MAIMKICSVFRTIIVSASLILAIGTSSYAAKKQVIAPSYAWKMMPPLGLREPASIDTNYIDYSRQAIPSAISAAYATTGNLGAEGINMIFFEREPMSDFFFRDALRAWIPSINTMKFYNTRLPMTLLSYNTGGSKETTQDRLSGTFSGNINSKAQVGALIDYLYSKGSYNYQATKDLIWGFSGSYIGDRYEFQGYLNHYNLLNKENGGITDDRYITDPAEIQGGSTSVNTKTIPTNLSAAHSKIVETELLLNNRYKVGYWHEEEIDDTTTRRTYIPVSSFIWTLKYNEAKHIFKNDAPGEAANFWEHTYLNGSGTYDRTTYSTLTNTLGISLLEGFHKYAKAGLGAYVTHQLRKYHQTTDTVDRLPVLPEGLSPYPVGKVPEKTNENLIWAGAQLTKQRGSLLTYDATAEIGVVGPVAGDLKIDGRISTRFHLLRDSVTITGYGSFTNREAPYLMNHYVSNHFIWDNDFGKERRFRAGGILDVPFSNTRVNIGVENIQNYIYFGDNSMPTQHGGSVQVFSATVNQNFSFRALHWENRLTYQTSSEECVIPLPKFAVYSNLYLLFKIATLHVQLGVDCDYYTKYYAPAYQPATMSFHTQKEIKLGNYPFMNLYANMKLSKTRFYLLYSHFNKGMFGGDNYFSSPHYPLNPSRFLLGVSVDFAN